MVLVYLPKRGDFRVNLGIHIPAPDLEETSQGSAAKNRCSTPWELPATFRSWSCTVFVKVSYILYMYMLYIFEYTDDNLIL